MTHDKEQFYISHPSVENMDGIEFVANNCGEFLVANNRMLYYLCCTVFSKTSFVLVSEGKVCAYLFAFHDAGNNYIWLHQLAVLENLKDKKRYGGFLFKKLLDLAESEGIDRIRFAIRKDNEKPLRMLFKMHGQYNLGFHIKISSLGIENSINHVLPMEIFELHKQKTL